MMKLTTVSLLTLAVFGATASLAQTAPAGEAQRAQRGPMGAGAEITRTQVQERSIATFARMDANGDGMLNAADREARRTAAFDRIDTDSNGAISREEFAARQQGQPGARGEARGAKPGGMAMGMMRGMRGMGGGKADTDGDKAVSQAEFAAAALARFDNADANKDGRITADEMRSQRQMRRSATPRQPG
jgi:hypothetical protein